MAPRYERSTAPTDIDALPTDMRAALDAYAVRHQLALAETLPAWLTRSVNPPSTTLLGRLFHRRANPTDPDSEHQTVTVLHPSELIIIVSGARRGVTVLSVPLASASLSPGPAVGSAGGSDDNSVSVSGFPGDDGRPGTFYLGLGPEPAGRECRESLRAAITAARNP
ncbi:hypothetical protein [Gordonia insulae]|uniref:Uncharacterized protein n=1 Tax=Gordonia insulae TaxID=2420509 RepID=A0A3G8JJD0_9ACTN|nr:hypothetical protein [Gordonia insulae]AZG45191.1 hypothetical protein D7316_01785 [Gordonia insulae]